MNNQWIWDAVLDGIILGVILNFTNILLIFIWGRGEIYEWLFPVKPKKHVRINTMISNGITPRCEPNSPK